MKNNRLESFTVKSFFHPQIFLNLSPLVLSLGIVLAVTSTAPKTQAQKSEAPLSFENEFITQPYLPETKTLFETKEEIVTETIPFETIYEDDGSLEKGSQEERTAGQNGQRVKTFAVNYYEGEEIDRELTREEITEPINKIIAIGTKIIIRNIETDLGNLNYTQKLNVYATPYTLQSAGGSGKTATGTIPHYGTIAVDPRVIPLGTKMYIPGYGIGIAEDTGGAIKGNIIDLFYEGSHGWWSSKYVEIYILQ